MERLRRLRWNGRTVPPERARRLTGIRRNLTTTSGDVTLHVPRLKGVSFETAIIERLNRDIRRRTRVVGAFPDGNSAFKIARYQLFPINKKPASVKRLTLFCVGVTYLPGPSPAKYCQQK